MKFKLNTAYFAIFVFCLVFMVAVGSKTLAKTGTAMTGSALNDVSKTVEENAENAPAQINFNEILKTIDDYTGANQFIQTGESGVVNLTVYYISRIVSLLVSLGTVLAIIAVVYTGTLYITALSNETNIEKAKKNLIGAAIGLAIMVSAFVIVRVLTATVATFIRG